MYCQSFSIFTKPPPLFESTSYCCLCANIPTSITTYQLTFLINFHISGKLNVKTQTSNETLLFFFSYWVFLCSSSCSSFTLLFLLDFLECLSNTTHSPPGHLNVQHTKTKQVFVFIWIPTQTIHPLPKTPNEEKTLHSHTHEELELDLLVYCVCTNALLILFVDSFAGSFVRRSFVRSCMFIHGAFGILRIRTYTPSRHQHY